MYCLLSTFRPIFLLLKQTLDYIVDFVLDHHEVIAQGISQWLNSLLGLKIYNNNLEQFYKFDPSGAYQAPSLKNRHDAMNINFMI